MAQKSNEILSRTDRVKRGFHRIGMVMLVLFAALGSALAIYSIIDWGYIRYGDISRLIGGFSSIGVFFYLMFRSIGWVVAGFLRD